MEEAIKKSLIKVDNILDKVHLLEIRILSYIAQHRQPDAVNNALELLEMLDIKFPKNPGTHHIIINLIKTSGKLKKIKSASDLQLAEMKDKRILSAMYVMAKVLSASYYVNPKLFPLIVFKLIDLTLKYGISPKSPVSFVTYGLLLNAIGKTKQGYLNGQIGMQMFEKLNATEHWAQAACINHSGVSIWKEPIDNSINGLFDAYKVAIDTGDTEFAVASAAAGLSYKLHAGRDIRALFIEAKRYKNSLSYLKQKVPINQIDIILQTSQNFIEGAKDPYILNGEFYKEDEMLAYFIKIKDNASTIDLYLKKMMLAYHYKNYEQAAIIATKARKIINDVAGLLLHSLFHFYESLILLANLNTLKSVDINSSKKRIKANQVKLKKWSKDNPANFENKYLLIQAELEKLKGNVLKADNLYEKSIHIAQKEGFILEQALANELAGTFWLSLNKQIFAQVFISQAYKLYNIWGAIAIANTLKTKYDSLIVINNINESSGSTATRTVKVTGTTSYRQSFDLETILDASKAISSEIILPELIRKTLSIILEHAGAQQAALLLKENNNELLIRAFGTIDKKYTLVTLRNEKISSENISVSVINYVERTKEIIILHDAVKKGDFTQDEYIKRNNIKSIIAIPIIHQSKFLGILYLENKLATYVFNEKRVNVLSILSTQAAIYMENAILFNSMEQKVIERTEEITEKNKLLQQQKKEIEKSRDLLTKHNATKDKFFSIIAHDLRGPIGNMNTFLDLISLKFDKFDKDKLKELILGLRETSKKTYDLLDNLLIWAQNQRKEIKYSPNEYDISEIVDFNISLIEHSANSKGIVIKNETIRKTNAWFDKNLIDLVVRNLLNNAIKYSENDDIITISSKKSDNELIISVKDTGIGMNEKTKTNLFRIDNKQASKIGTNGEKGTGLGLILCKDFIEKNKGGIWVESEVNIGSVFSFSLPINA